MEHTTGSPRLPDSAADLPLQLVRTRRIAQRSAAANLPSLTLPSAVGMSWRLTFEERSLQAYALTHLGGAAPRAKPDLIESG
jgi:hypothetical protein